MAEQQAGAKVGNNRASVRYGVYNQPGSYAGRTVGDVQKELSKIWNMPNDARAFKGKTQLDANYVIQEGEQIDFHRKMGEKGI